MMEAIGVNLSLWVSASQKGIDLFSRIDNHD